MGTRELHMCALLHNDANTKLYVQQNIDETLVSNAW